MEGVRAPLQASRGPHLAGARSWPGPAPSFNLRGALRVLRLSSPCLLQVLGGFTAKCKLAQGFFKYEQTGAYRPKYFLDKIDKACALDREALARPGGIAPALLKPAMFGLGWISAWGLAFTPYRAPALPNGSRHSLDSSWRVGDSSSSPELE